MRADPSQVRTAARPAGTPVSSAGTDSFPAGPPLGPAHQARRRRRRRLLVASAPIVLLVALVAVKLLSLNLVHGQTLAAYRDADRARMLTWSERQGWFNIAEPFRAPFALGDAHVLEGDFVAARPWFEQAFDLVPKGGVDDCKVRVNLGLTYERLGDAAQAGERTLEWEQFYAKGIEITRNRPPLCDLPERAGQTGELLREAEQRMQDKSRLAPAPQPEQQAPPPGPPQPGPPQPAPDAGTPPSERQQELLRERQRQNTIERERRLGDRAVPPGDGGNPYPRPW
jgi:hypothetical protein